MRRRRILATLAALGALALAGAACSGRASREGDAGKGPAAGFTLSPEQRQKVRTLVLALRRFRRSIETTGTVSFDADQATQVVSPLSGPVSRLLVSLGIRVEKGQALAEVASPDFAADASAYRKAEALARNARHIADLDEKLYETGGIARRDMEQAETDAVSTEADRDAARQQLRALGVDDARLEALRENQAVGVGPAVIRAPVAGVVVERLVTPGQLLQAGTTPCFTVADLSTVWVMANVFETDLPFVEPGDPASITTGEGEPALPGTVQYVSALVDPSTRAVAVRVTAKNPTGALRKDLYVRVAIQSRRDSTGLLVPASAVLRDDENLPFAFVARADGRFDRRRVTLGTRVGDEEEVTSGLGAGEEVVTEGGLFLQFAESQ
jgi:cobalt-zinc-cadmium efflux system membrane fusion protein